jgi:hypothetical protein
MCSKRKTALGELTNDVRTKAEQKKLIKQLNSRTIKIV